MKKLFSLLVLLVLLSIPSFAAFAGDDPDETPDSVDDAAVQSDSAGTAQDENGAVSDVPSVEVKPEHVSSVAIYPADKIIHAKLQTSIGDISCDLYAGNHPLTVLNFISLAKGEPSWSDASGRVHRDPYYKDIKFADRASGAYVLSGLRSEGTNFVIADERCESHTMEPGAIAMVQPYPGMAATQFVLLAKAVPAFAGMYPVFGKCGPIELISELTRKEAVLLQVSMDE